MFVYVHNSVKLTLCLIAFGFTDFRQIVFPVIQISQQQHIMEIMKISCHTITHLWQKFHENNVFSKEVTKELIRRKKLSVTVISFFHTVSIVGKR